MLWREYGAKNWSVPKPENKSLLSLLQFNDYRGIAGGYEFSKLGKIPMGALSLMLFNQVQEPMLLRKLQKLERAVEEALQPSAFCTGELTARPFCLRSLPQNLMDLKLYRIQLRHILNKRLYYLEVRTGDQLLYKIGVTQRLVEERVKEIQTEMQSFFGSAQVKVLSVWEHRGNVERYFKHRYQWANYPIENRTEYFKFDDPRDAKATLRDLRRMKPKVLSSAEEEILAGCPSFVEQRIEAEKQAYWRSQAIRTGMKYAAKWGKHVGRPPGQESLETFLAKPSSQRAIAALNRGMSLRQSAEESGVSVNTLRKVKALLDSLDFTT